MWFLGRHWEGSRVCSREGYVQSVTAPCTDSVAASCLDCDQLLTSRFVLLFYVSVLGCSPMMPETCRNWCKLPKFPNVYACLFAITEYLCHCDCMPHDASNEKSLLSKISWFMQKGHLLFKWLVHDRTPQRVLTWLHVVPSECLQPEGNMLVYSFWSIISCIK